MNITTVMAIISVTVFFTGSTAKMVLDGLNSWFPQDKIYSDPKEVEDDASSIEGEGSQDFGYINESEREEKSFFKSFLIKQSNLDTYDPLGERFLPYDVIFASLSVLCTSCSVFQLRSDSIFRKK